MPEPTKRCSKCKTAKPLDEFKRDRRRESGCASICAVCNRANAKRWVRLNPDIHNALTAKYRRRHPDRCNLRVRTWRAAHPGAGAAYTSLWEAIHAGRVLRPDACAECKRECKLDGHHHRGYDKPLDVIWLCRRCHVRLHQRQVNDPPTSTRPNEER